jgi:KTSC domain
VTAAGIGCGYDQVLVRGRNPMVILNSSAIRAAAYDASTLTLSITFTSGKTYDYYGVPQAIYLGLIGAASAGEYFNAYIRDRYSSNR